MMKKLIYMTVAALAFMGCQQQNGKDETEGYFETMMVTKQDITLYETFPASIEGRQSIKIIPHVEGYLREIRVKEGQQVKRGQVLFVIDSEELHTALAKVEKTFNSQLSTTVAITQLLASVKNQPIRYRERFLIPHRADEYLIVPLGKYSATVSHEYHQRMVVGP